MRKIVFFCLFLFPFFLYGEGMWDGSPVLSEKAGNRVITLYRGADGGYFVHNGAVYFNVMGDESAARGFVQLMLDGLDTDMLPMWASQIHSLDEYYDLEYYDMDGQRVADVRVVTGWEAVIVHSGLTYNIKTYADGGSRVYRKEKDGDGFYGEEDISYREWERKKRNGSVNLMARKPVLEALLNSVRVRKR